jgi:tetratricopeptide (TPR) repeat protein
MYDAALDQFQKTVELFPAHLPAYVHLGMTYMALNRLAEAISTLEKANGLSGGVPPVLSLVGCSYARAGQRDKAEGILAKLV